VIGSCFKHLSTTQSQQTVLIVLLLYLEYFYLGQAGRNANSSVYVGPNVSVTAGTNAQKLRMDFKETLGKDIRHGQGDGLRICTGPQNYGSTCVGL